MTENTGLAPGQIEVSTHMPLARHDVGLDIIISTRIVSTHMPLARHDSSGGDLTTIALVSTHMPLARHDNPV